MFIYEMSEFSRFSSTYNTNISEEQRSFGIIDNHGAYLSIHKYKQERWFIFTCKRYDDKHCWKNFHHGKNDSIEENSSGSSKYKPFKNKNPRLYFWNIVLYILRVLWEGNAQNSYTTQQREILKFFQERFWWPYTICVLLKCQLKNDFVFTVRHISGN